MSNARAGRRTAIAPLFFLVLVGCTTFFAPAYDKSIEAKLDGAVTKIQELGAAFDLADRGKNTYPEFEPRYIAILGELRAAAAIAQGRVGIYAGKPSGEAAKLVADSINNCQGAVSDVALQHKEHGMTGQLFKLTVLDETCTLALKSEQALK